MIVTRNGIRYDESIVNQLTITDPDGNQMTSNGSFIDTMGRTVNGPPYGGVVVGANAACPSISDDPFGNIAFQPVVSSSKWDVQGANGSTLHYLFCYTNVSGHTNFFAANGSSYNVQGDYDYQTEGTVGEVLQSVLLPNGTSWFFIYDAGDPGDANAISYGDILQIRTPQGATQSYTYKTGTSTINTTVYNRYVTSRTVDAGDGPKSWRYNYGPLEATAGYLVTTTDPDGNDAVTTFTPLAPQGSLNWVETDHKLYQGSSRASTPIVLSEKQTSYQSALDSQSPNSGDGGANYDRTAIFPTKEVISNLAGQTVTKTYVYDSGFQDTQPNCRSANQCGYTYPVQITFGNKTSTTISTNDGYNTTTSTTYQGQSSPTSAYDQQNGYYIANRVNLPSTTSTVDQNNVLISQTSWGYDEGTIQPSNITTQHTSPSSEYRGHVTSTSTTVIAPGVANSVISTGTQWYDTGVPFKQTDGRGFTSATILYDPGYFGAYPTSVANAAGYSTNYAYDVTSGQIRSRTDPNSQTTQYCYRDDGRLVGALFPDGGGTAWNYDDQGHTVTKSVLMKGTNGSSCPGTLSGTLNQTLTTYDGLGRATQTQALSDPSGVDSVDTTYDNMSRVHTVTNPHRPSILPTDGTTTFTYDALGRKTGVNRTDGSSLTCKYLGNNVDFWDEVGAHWSRNSDALGRLTQVYELGTAAAPLSLQSQYSYNLQNNLTGVTQFGTGSEAARQRSFSYDNLSRLITAYNPETGTVCYGIVSGSNCINGYDGNGNLLAKTDARGAVASYSYDSQNRLLQKSYTTTVGQVVVAAPTPTVTYTYDLSSTLNAANVVGRLTDETVSDTSGILYERSVSAYDPMGRIATDLRCVPGVCPKLLGVNYTYDQAGNESSSATSTTTMSYGYDAMGRAISENYASGKSYGKLMGNVLYSPLGGITSANGFETRVYDSRGRTSSITYSSFTAASNSQATNVAYAASYDYYLNGNMYHNNDSVNGNWTYIYDGLNRLSSAQSQTPGVGTQTYSYDSFGNRLSQSGVLTNYATYNNPTNRADCPTCYDAAGNVLQDVNAYLPHSYSYDAEGRLSNVTDLGYQYVYDGEGTRVAVKQNGVPTKAYVHNVNDQSYAVLDGAGHQTSYEFYGAGRHIFSLGKDIYLPILDASGTERVRQGIYGHTTQNCTNLPFGDGLNCGAPDPSQIHFTGHERDTESGLDFFGARHYTSSMGRFMSPDWSSSPQAVPYALLSNPQSLNLYSYVANNPVSGTDADGHRPGGPRSSNEFGAHCDQFTGCTFGDPYGGADATITSAWSAGEAEYVERLQQQRAGYWQNKYALFGRNMGAGALADREVFYTLKQANGKTADKKFYVSEVITPQLSDVPWADKFTSSDPLPNQFDDTIGSGLVTPSKPTVVQQYFVMSEQRGLKPEHFERVPVSYKDVLYYSQTITINTDRSVTIQFNANQP